MPELEFGQASDEWLELVSLLRRQATCLSVLHLIVYGLVRWVEFRLEEGEEEVEEVDSQGIRNYIDSQLMAKPISEYVCDEPMYHPCSRNILRKKMTRRDPVPSHLYAVNGVDLSRYV